MSLVFSYQSKFPGPASHPTKQADNNARMDNISKAMPSKFYPSDNSSLFSNARNAYSRDAGIEWQSQNFSTSWNDGAGVAQKRRINAIGKASIQSTATQQSLSFRRQDKNDVTRAKRRARSGGAIAPAKKGANNSFQSGGRSILSGHGNRQIYAP